MRKYWHSPLHPMVVPAPGSPLGVLHGLSTYSWWEQKQVGAVLVHGS